MAQRGELTEDEEDAQCEEHHGKPQTPDPQALIICSGNKRRTRQKASEKRKLQRGAITMNSRWLNLLH